MTQTNESPLPEFIGNATMEQDGTLVLQLFAEDNTHDRNLRGSAVFRYAPDSPQYADILRHVGPIQPGGKVDVRPWPDK